MALEEEEAAAAAAVEVVEKDMDMDMGKAWGLEGVLVVLTMRKAWAQDMVVAMA